MGLERWAGAVRKKYRAGDRVRLSRKALAARVGSARSTLPQWPCLYRATRIGTGSALSGRCGSRQRCCVGR